MDKKTVVISGVNLVDGGPLSVFEDFLNTLVYGGYTTTYRVIALVGKKELFKQYEGKIELQEYRKAKKSWLYRLYLEYFGFKKLSKKLNVEFWVSMHDTTPNVKAKHRYVYCHNPSPFNKMSIRDAKYGYKYYLFSKFYKYLYMINIKKNDAVIVQQDWMRTEFVKMFGLKKVIVARPSLPEMSAIENIPFSTPIFICPSFPRYYKNFQIVCEAAKELEEEGNRSFKLIITLDGSENSYSRFLLNQYGRCQTINFIGLIDRERLFKLYGESACMIFMSKLETWGMPITEYKVTNKPMILANLPYAHETIGDYDNVAFVDVDNVDDLKNQMLKVIEKNHLSSSKSKPISNPYANNWNELCSLLFFSEQENNAN